MSQKVKVFGPRVRTLELAPKELIHQYAVKTTYLGDVTVYDDFYLTVQASTVTMHDVVTKDYVKRVRLGEVISNPMSRRKVTFVAVPGTRQDTYYNRPYAGHSSTTDRTGIVTYMTLPHIWPEPNMFLAGRNYHWQYAIDRVYDKAQAATLSTIVDLFEMPETISMLRQLVDRLKSGYGLLKDLPRTLSAVRRAARHKNRRARLRRTLRVLGLGRRVQLSSLTGLWLEWRFGWSPLIKSLYDLCEALENSISKDKPPRITYRATQPFEYREESANTAQISYLTGAPGIDAVHTTVSEYKGQIRAGILMRNPGLSLGKEFGLRASDLPSAVWDLVPYSFVVDRLLHVSTWLNAIQARDSRDVPAAWAVERSVRTIIYRRESVSGSQTTGTGSTQRKYTVLGTANSFETITELVSRDVGVKPGMLPQFDVDLSTFTNLKHSLDYIALIIARLRSSAGRRTL